MQVNRGNLLNALRLAGKAAVKPTSCEVFDQAKSFVFTEEQLVTYNDEVMFKGDNPIKPFTGAVSAEELLAVVGRLPDEELEVIDRNNEIVLRGKRKSAGLAYTKEIQLPIKDVPPPGEWFPIEDQVLAMMQQAARTCGKDFAAPLTTMVHVTPKRIEGCDNQRLYRYTGKTGFPERILIPATGVAALHELDITKVSVGKGWTHFRDRNKSVFSIRSSHEKYNDQVDQVLEVKGGAKVSLPSNLKDILERAEAMKDSTFDNLVMIKIEDDRFHITARRDTGWYKEHKRINYSGPPLEFEVNPVFLHDVLTKTHDVLVSDRKMKITLENVEFVVALAMPKPKKSSDTDDDKPKDKKGTPSEPIAEDDIPF